MYATTPLKNHSSRLTDSAFLIDKAVQARDSTFKIQNPKSKSIFKLFISGKKKTFAVLLQIKFWKRCHVPGIVTKINFQFGRRTITFQSVTWASSRSSIAPQFFNLTSKLAISTKHLPLLPTPKVHNIEIHWTVNFWKKRSDKISTFSEKWFWPVLNPLAIDGYCSWTGSISWSFTLINFLSTGTCKTGIESILIEWLPFQKHSEIGLFCKFPFFGFCLKFNILSTVDAVHLQLDSVNTPMSVV